MKLWGRTHSLQRKIITAIVMVGLLPLSFSLVLTYVEEQKALRDTIGANFKEVAVETARRIETQVSRSSNEAQQLAATPFLRTAVTEANRSYAGKDEKYIQSTIKDWQRRWKEREKRTEFPLFINRIVTNYLIRWHDIRRADYMAIFVTDNQGALVVSSIPQVEYYHGRSVWWQTVFGGGRGQAYVGDIYFDPAFGTHVLNVSVPILGDDQRTAIGAVSVLLRRDSLFHTISEVTVGATGHAMLLSSDGTPLICPVLGPEEHTVTPSLITVVTRPAAGWGVVSNDSHGGQNSIVGFSPVRLGDHLVPGSLGGKQWLILVRQNPEETYAPLNQLLVTRASYGVFVFAVLLAMGVWAARWIVRPIRILQEGAQRIGAGGLDHQLMIRTGDEIEELAGAFNRMAANLKQSFGQLQVRTGEIEETKNYLESLLENANDVIYTLDTEQRFTYVNNRVSIWGYRKDEIIGRPYLSLLSKRHRGRRMKSTLDMSAKQVYEVEILSRTGEVKTATVSVSPLYDRDGRIVGALGIARDITETKKLEQQFRNAEKLASVGKLAAGVAHEINNPLGGILNCLHNLRKGTLTPARQEEYLVSMEDGLRRVQKIVRQLLEFSQQHEPELSMTDINTVVERVLVLTNHAFEANRVSLEKQLQDGLPGVMVDRHMIEQVLMNLILNAIQAIKGGGAVTIRTRLMDDTCAIEVQDTGCGIPPHLLSRIFDPFFTTKGTGEGTGLGLSVSLGIVERHGGRILVESEVGKGTLFTVCLPLSREHEAVGKES
jgi:PAS domain S-box-containing protein